MAVSPETLAPIDRTQPLPLAPSLAKTSASAAPDKQDDGVENNTVYVSFDAAGGDLANGPDSVQGLLENDSHSTAIRQVPSTKPPRSSEPGDLVQIQALELAAQRAEIARQERELDEIQRALRLR